MNGSTEPLVGVVIPAYNAREFVVETVASVLGQSWSSLRLVVVDDGSSDGTADLVRAAFDDPRMSVHRHDNVGVARSRNVGASLVEGEYLAFLDADDLWQPDALVRRVAALKAHPGWQAVGGLMQHIDATGRVLGISGQAIVADDDPARARVATADLLPCPLSTLLLRRDAFLALGGFDEGLVVDVPAMVEDLDLVSRLAQRGSFGVMDEVVGGYRMHGGSASAMHHRNQRAGARFVRARLAARQKAGDLTWNEWQATQSRSLSLYMGDTAALLYRRAGLAAAERAWVSMVLNGLGALAHGPRYTVRRALMQRRIPFGRQPHDDRASQSEAVPRVDVLGVQVSALDPQRALQVIAGWIDDGAREYVCVTGVHGVIESQDDPALREVHNRSGMTVPDGMPLVWCCRRAGRPETARVYGPDLILSVLELAAARGWSSYFYGGAEGVAHELATVMTGRFPGLVVAGTWTPPFRPLTADEDAQVVADINASGADLVWVGLSTPKQERWMAEHRARLTPAVLLGVGAAFDFHTGRVRQAPVWMQSRGLEWFFRLVVEPRRLWRRYLRNNPRFLVGIVRRPPRPVPTARS